EEARKRFRHGLAAEAEGVVVHGHHGGCAEIEEGAQGFLRAGVDAAIGVGEVSADGQEGNVRMEAAADFMEAVEPGGVTGVVDGGGCGSGDGVAAEAAMRVVEEARAPVLCGSRGDGKRIKRGGLPPGE